MKRREKTGGSAWSGQGLPTVVPSSSRSRSTSPHKRASFGRMVPFRRQRRGSLHLCGALRPSSLPFLSSIPLGRPQLPPRPATAPFSSCDILTTSTDCIHVLFLFSILGAVYKIVRWLQESTFETDAAEFSNLTVHVSSSGTGLMNKYFYRFGNVRMLRGRMKFFYDPAGPFVPPTEECVFFNVMDRLGTRVLHPIVRLFACHLIHSPNAQLACSLVLLRARQALGGHHLVQRHISAASHGARHQSRRADQVAVSTHRLYSCDERG